MTETLPKKVTDVGDLTDELVRGLQSDFSAFSLHVKKKITDFIGLCIDFSISLENALGFYESCDREHLPNVDIEVFIKYTISNRSPNVILPSICRCVSVQPSNTNLMNEDVIVLIAEKINNFSSPECDENKRMAAAKSLGLLQIVLAANESLKEPKIAFEP